MKLLKNLFRWIGNVEKRLEMSNELFDKSIDFSSNMSLQIVESLKKLELILYKEIENIKKSHSDLVGVCCVDGSSWLMLSIQEDYFTKELIKIDATNTRRLYVISWKIVSEYYFKEWNQTEDVQKINECFYLFI